MSKRAESGRSSPGTGRALVPVISQGGSNPMTRFLYLIGLLSLAMGASCTAGQVSSQPSGVTCYDTGHGVVCTKGGEEGEDADGDGTTDPVTCQDGDDDDGDGEA